jgi:hypothetical protein
MSVSETHPATGARDRYRAARTGPARKALDSAWSYFRAEIARTGRHDPARADRLRREAAQVLGDLAETGAAIAPYCRHCGHARET